MKDDDAAGPVALLMDIFRRQNFDRWEKDKSKKENKVKFNKMEHIIHVKFTTHVT